MVNNSIRRWILRGALTILLLLLSLEIAAQLLRASEIGRVAYIAHGIGLPEVYMHPKNLSIVTEHSSLFDWKSDPSIKTERFRTDAYGTIYPSTFSAAMTKGGAYALFCGGSTTECAFVGEENRVPDVFSKAAGIPSVNAGRSGKDLQGCAETLAYLGLRGARSPQFVLISTNVNTLMSFGLGLDSHQDSRRWMQILLPGLHLLFGDKAAKSANTTRIPPAPVRPADASIRYSAYEESLWDGCCYGPAMFNRYKVALDWGSQKNQEAYAEYVRRGIARLSTTLDDLGWSRDNAIIFIEPNSFAEREIAARRDYRQRLHTYDGKPLSLHESQDIISTYDAIYEAQFLAAGYRVVRVPSDYMSGDDFYDAVHLTRQGSEKVGKFLARAVRP